MITINIEENASPDGTERRIFSLWRVLYPKKAGLSNFFILHRAKKKVLRTSRGAARTLRRS
jgi:hypothetical protein